MEVIKKYFDEVWPEEEAILKLGLERSRESKAERTKKKMTKRFVFGPIKMTKFCWIIKI